MNKRQTIETTCDTCGNWMAVDYDEFVAKAEASMLFICKSCRKQRKKKRRFWSRRK